MHPAAAESISVVYSVVPRIGLWLTLCTLNIYLLTYLLSIHTYKLGFSHTVLLFLDLILQLGKATSIHLSQSSYHYSFQS